MRVVLLPQSRSIELLPGRTILDAALAAGVNLPHSCKGGGCGSCRARLISGSVSYPRGTPLGLSQSEVDQGHVLLCQAHATSDLTVEAREIRHVTDVQIKSLPCRIERLERWAPDVMGVYLRLPVIEDFMFRAGQYLDVMQKDLRRRSFSIASPPHDAGLLELHIRKVTGGGFTSAVFEQYAPGTLLRIEGPLGQFTYREPEDDAARPAILIAGGTGFAPIKSLLRHALETGTSRILTVYWGARERVDLYQDEWLRDQQRRFKNLQYVPVLSAPAAQESLQLRTGNVHTAVLEDFADLSGHDVYAAGPPALIQALQSSLPARGLAYERFYFDSFDYAPDSQRP
jgi:CDP-4-dehydro-6-deoxyglucose reductase, E3